ncbi:MAG: cupredoxin domain-containing protein [Nitrososphaerota archaeon]
MSKLYPVLGLVSLVIAVAALAIVISQSSSISAQLNAISGRLNELGGQLADLAAKTAPKTHKFTIIMGEGEIVQEVDGEEAITGEFHRWEPPVLVVKKGDTVELTVKNPRSHAHSFVLTDFAVDTGRIPGRAEQPDEAKRAVTVTFIANKAGVFQFKCGVPHDHEKGDCDPDHARMTGYLIVLEG